MILAEFANIVNSLEDLMILTKALTRDDTQNWKVVVEEEMIFLRKNNAWLLSKLLANYKTIGCKWVFWTKRNAHGQIVHHKAKFVTKGYA